MDDDSQPGEARPIEPGAVFGGAVLGFIASWALFAVGLFAAVATYGEGTNTTRETVIGVGSVLLVPVVSGALMISPRTRQWGAGVLIGMAIGSLIGAGICIGNMHTWV